MTTTPQTWTRATLGGAFLLAAALAALFYYKWGGSWGVVDGVRGTGIWSRPADGLTAGGALAATGYYFGKVWIALAFGLVIGAAVKTALSPRWVASLLGAGAGGQAAGGLAGAPLMLCSCCVTPVFSSVYACGARLGPALGLMLAAPGLNPAALLLTFMLFPIELSATRLLASLLAVFALPVLVERVSGTLAPARLAGTEEDAPPPGLGALAGRFAANLGRLTLQTVPLIAAGVLVSSLVIPTMTALPPALGLVAVAGVALFAVMVALPTFFEIPLAMLLLELGLPGGAAAILVAGPIVNLPSLLVLGRETSARTAGALGAGIFALALGAGALAQGLA